MAEKSDQCGAKLANTVTHIQYESRSPTSYRKSHFSGPVQLDLFTDVFNISAESVKKEKINNQSEACHFCLLRDEREAWRLGDDRKYPQDKHVEPVPISARGIPTPFHGPLGV